MNLRSLVIPENTTNMSSTAENHELEEDVITVPGQLFALMSFVGPTGTSQRNDKFGIKIRGCFGTRDEADRHVKRLQQVDKIFDIYLVDMGKWLLIPPEPNSIENQEYQEGFLNDMVKGYRENQAQAKEHFIARKEAIQRDGLDAHLLDSEKIPRPDHTPIFTEEDPLMARQRVKAAEQEIDAADNTAPVAIDI